jgi:hypothetical protein
MHLLLVHILKVYTGWARFADGDGGRPFYCCGGTSFHGAPGASLKLPFLGWGFYLSHIIA